MGYSADILNAVRMECSEEYQARIPEASQATFTSIGQAFDTYTVLANEFLSALFNQIGKTIIEMKMFNNKLSRFKGGLVSPRDIQEIFIEMAKAEGAYDKDGKNPLGRRTPSDIKVIYHRKNREDCYAKSIGDIDFVRVFQSENTVDAFIKGQINSIYSGDAYDEWLAMKNVLATYKRKDKSCGYFDYDVNASADSEQFAKAFVKTLRKAVQDVQFPSKQYNVAGVLTWTEPSDLVLLVNKDVLVEVDVERLATAFHDSKTDLKVVPTIISMDDFGTLADTYALLVDKDWFRIYDTLVKTEPQRNAQGLFTNYFFHHHQILSASTFKNAIRIKKASA